MNKYYNYQGIEMLDMAYWKDRNSMVWSLGTWISLHNKDYLRQAANLNFYNQRTDGEFNYKTHSVTYPDLIEQWEKRGLAFRTGEMAGVCWFTMYPEVVKMRQVRNPNVLIVLHDGDYQNPNYMMNALEYYRHYHEVALENDWVVLYVIPDGGDEFCMFISILQELCSILHIEPAKIGLDVGAVYRLGESLASIPDFQYLALDGSVVANPDEMTEYLDDIRYLDITSRWTNTNSSLVRFINGGAFSHPDFDLDNLKHSKLGKRLVQAITLEQDYHTPDDPELLRHWEEMGLVFEKHTTDHEQWLSFIPKSAFDCPDEKLPVVAIFQEVGVINPFLSISAFASYYEWFDIAANGETALLFFALESADDNDLYVDIINEVVTNYPIDPQRVYLTGHSHNAHFLCEFARRHPKLLAAIAPLGMSHGIPEPEHSHEVIKVSEEMLRQSAKFDLPIININGYFEDELALFASDTDDYAHAIRALQRRFRASRCPVPSENAIRTAKNSSDKVTRILAIPANHTEIQHKYGRECYIADIKNVDNKNHLRLVSIEQMIHAPAPQMASLSWDFLRRFERNLENGEIIERY
ncbi:hypothetical protein [Streptococcus merionis]|uniref:hypothetical protein n=1 Tax=Streptococcus merionis TaxID=400065 RepID=UPI0026EB62A3|nr:hypothetical protein [Streptococcus merionis]